MISKYKHNIEKSWYHGYLWWDNAHNEYTHCLGSLFRLKWYCRNPENISSAGASETIIGSYIPCIGELLVNLSYNIVYLYCKHQMHKNLLYKYTIKSRYKIWKSYKLLKANTTQNLNPNGTDRSSPLATTHELLQKNKKISQLLSADT